MQQHGLAFCAQRGDGVGRLCQHKLKMRVLVTVRASSGAQLTLADEYLKGKTIDELVAMVARLTKP